MPNDNNDSCRGGIHLGGRIIGCDCLLEAEHEANRGLCLSHGRINTSELFNSEMRALEWIEISVVRNSSACTAVSHPAMQMLLQLPNGNLLSTETAEKDIDPLLLESSNGLVLGVLDGHA